MDLEGTRVTDRGLEVLSTLPRLRRLNISDLNISETGVKTFIERAPTLKVIILNQNLLSQEYKNRLWNSERGIILIETIAGTSPEAKGLAPLERTRRYLALLGIRYSLAELKNIRYLNLKRVPVNDESMAYLSVLTTLETLQLGNRLIGRAGLRHLRPLKDLRVLYLYNTDIDDAALGELAGFKKLERLYLEDTRIGDEGLRHLRGFINLKILSLYKTNVTDRGLVSLVALKNLEFLYLQDTRITDRGLAHLSRLKKLKGLYLSGTRVSDEGLKNLEALPSLWSLEVPATTTSADTRRRFQDSRPDLYLRTARFYIWKPDPGRFRRFLQPSRRLILKQTARRRGAVVTLAAYGHYNFAGLRFSDEEAEYLGRTLLGDLDFTGARITDVGFLNLVRTREINRRKHLIASKKNAVIRDKIVNEHQKKYGKNSYPLVQDRYYAIYPGSTRSLSLAYTLITDKSVSLLVKFPSLAVLRLDGTGVTDAGLAHLKKNKYLEHLSLSGLDLKGPGLTHLKGMSGLRILDLRHTKIGDKDLEFIPFYLVALDLRHTRVSPAGVRRLKTRLARSGYRCTIRY